MITMKSSQVSEDGAVSYTHLDVYKRQALLIPVLSYLTQMLNIKLMPQATNGNDQMANQMKMMNCLLYTSRCV